MPAQQMRGYVDIPIGGGVEGREGRPDQRALQGLGSGGVPVRS